ncbi:MAG: FAD-binding protein [Cyanobacteriota bacterium]|nr:FAD-binding protein [Cyanobacteriota bacterium]
MMADSLCADLSAQCPRLRHQANLRLSSTLRTSATAEWYAEPADRSELIGLIRVASRIGLPLHILGNGSNTLLAPYVQGLVICMKRFDQVLVEKSGQILVGAGLHNARLVQIAAGEGLTGLEFAIGIPGSIGGLVVMNANFNADQLVDDLKRRRFHDVNLHAHALVESVDVIGPNGEVYRLEGPELNFGYRHSVFLDLKRGWIVEAARLRFLSREKTRCKELIHLMARARAQKEERGIQSLGCVFRPRDQSYRHGGVVRPAQWFLDQVKGLKSWKAGGVGVDQHFSNHLVNRGTATAQDFVEMMDRMQSAVDQSFAVRLVPEVQALPHDWYLLGVSKGPLRSALLDARLAIDELDCEIVSRYEHIEKTCDVAGYDDETLARDIFSGVAPRLKEASMAAVFSSLSPADMKIILADYDYSHLPDEWFEQAGVFRDAFGSSGLGGDAYWAELMVKRLALVEDVALVKMERYSSILPDIRRLPPPLRFAAVEAVMRQHDREHQLFPRVMMLASSLNQRWIASLYKYIVLPYSFALQHLYFTHLDFSGF